VLDKALVSPPLEPLYRTKFGQSYISTIEGALTKKPIEDVRGKVDLLFTSPPFPLVKKKSYGNETGHQYVEWLVGLAPALCDLLSPTGSIVIELGNAWVKGSPTMSTLSLEALLAFRRAANLHLCQHLICHNPARLPTPAEWVAVKRTRLKDSFTHVWWMSKTENPKADNRRVLLPYSASMKHLLRRGTYNAGRRPSGHRLSKTGFLTDQGGSISPSVIKVLDNDAMYPESLLQFTGTAWDTGYRSYCKQRSLKAHPARMQPGLAGFFISFLTEPGDLVMDPFGGSNTTGAVAEHLQRRWVAVEADENFAEGSKGRFTSYEET
jgi:DNA modification methylase